MSEKVLFVGGVADGERLVNPATEYFKVARRASPGWCVSGFNDDRNFVECDLYRRERIRSGGVEFECYVLESMESEDFIACLINGYAKAKTPQ